MQAYFCHSLRRLHYELHTAIRAFRSAAADGDKDKASELLATTSRKLDKAASKGVIHKNQAANKKSALAHTLHKI